MWLIQAVQDLLPRGRQPIEEAAGAITRGDPALADAIVRRWPGDVGRYGKV